MTEQIKNILHLINKEIELSGIFYEYGTIKSSIIIILYLGVSLILLKDKIKIIKKINIKESLIVFILAALYSYVFYCYVGHEKYNYFYPSTTQLRFENIIILTSIYGITALIYNYLIKLIINNNFLVLLCTIAIVTSPLQLWIIFSSSSRDFIKAPILTLYFIALIIIIKGEIKWTNKIIFYYGSLMAIAMTFRQEIYLYFPIYVLVVILFTKLKLSEKLLLILKTILIVLPAYLYLTGGIINSIERASNRFIPGLSEDITRTYSNEPEIYIGPFNDLTADIITLDYNLKIEKLKWIDIKDFINDYISRIFQMMNETYLLPLKSNFYPESFDVSLIGSITHYMRAIVSIEEIYLICLIIIILKNLKNFKLLFFLLTTTLYLITINGLQFLNKNIFHLEIFTYIIIIYGISEIYNLKKISSVRLNRVNS